MSGKNVLNSPSRAESSGDAPLVRAGRSRQVTPRARRGWQEIEARRERLALKKMLAEAWDDDFDLDDDIFGDSEANNPLYRKNGSDDRGDELEEDIETGFDDDSDAGDYEDD